MLKTSWKKYNRQMSKIKTTEAVNGMADKKIAVVPGSYDPVTKGHLDLIEQAAALFDHVYVAICVNGEKKNSGLFTPEERLAFVEAAVAGYSNVTAEISDGLLSDFAKSKGALYLLKGARTGTDFDYEASLSMIMRHFDPALNSIIIPARQELSHLSSTYVRELLKYGTDIRDAVPEKAAALIQAAYDAKMK